MTVGPDRISTVEPTTAVVSIVTPERPNSVRTFFCNDVHFFSSEAARDWLGSHLDGAVIAVTDAYQICRSLSPHVLSGDTP